MRILATKKLTPIQKSMLKGYDVQQKEMISISYGENFIVNEKISHAIFTSANAVKSVFERNKNKKDNFDNVYCVGAKTKSLLASYGVKVCHVAKNASALAAILVEKEIEDLHFYCGNLRHQDLPLAMAEHGIMVTENVVYQTELSNHCFEMSFDMVMFFSPSGVMSYVNGLNSCNVKAICIGYTTATEAINCFEEVFVAEETTVESVIDKLKEISSH